MSSRHLPAGQSIPPAQGGPGAVVVGGGMAANGMPQGAVDMAMPGHAHGPNLGPRRRQQQQQQQQQQPAHPPPPHHHQYPHHYHQQHMTPPMYANYMPYGAPQPYYGMPPQYANGGMPSPGYMPYQNQGYPRSPPAAMHQYSPMVGVTVPPSYSRPMPQSPALSTPYQPPPVSVPVPPHTPSSTHSSQVPPPPTPPTPQTVESAASLAPSQEAPKASPPLKAPFRAPLPWLSRPDLPFPTRSSKLKTSRKLLVSGSANVSLPIDRHEPSAGRTKKENTEKEAIPASEKSQDAASQPKTPVIEKNTPATETAKPAQPSPANSTGTATTAKGSTASGRPAAQPALPLVSLPKSAPKAPASETTQQEVQEQSPVQAAGEASLGATATDAGQEAAAPAAAPKQAPSSWANLFSKPAALSTKLSGAASEGDSTAAVNGHDTGASSEGAASFLPKSNASNVADAIRAYKVGTGEKIGYIEPRGLINTGNMCYMNSILQVLMFCVPFYDFLNQVSRRAAHSFKSETPLIDAMIMFMHEFPVIKSAGSMDQLRRSLKPEEAERYGEPFIPEYVYAAIKQLPRFAGMRRGHQQDAEEFLGFLLQSLDDECTHVLGTSLSSQAASVETDSPVSDKGSDWLEVGRKQKAAVTRSSGTNITTPITKIFGGLLRSEFRVPGLKDSITTEPYQPLQLDIGAPEVRNVVDALRGLTRPERLQGDFNSPRGKDVSATKQVFIETLPPVLILHLKRFQFDAEGHGTIKIWKKIDYPLELEIPREALSRQIRQSDAIPKYKLISVVYHHGKNASGGHYTNDVRRSDGQDWLRFDDTVLRQVRGDDVAEKHLDEEEKNHHRKEPEPANATGNRYGAMDEETGDDDGWKQVTASANGNKRWSNVVNGSGNAAKGKQIKENLKENKVAYLLFYQRI